MEFSFVDVLDRDVGQLEAVDVGYSGKIFCTSPMEVAHRAQGGGIPSAPPNLQRTDIFEKAGFGSRVDDAVDPSLVVSGV